ncbi:MAG TPA: hypothetical protein VIM98_13640 [Dyella sp.]|uniref:hypothetical protein n=1 Tax=Dyella sp. TaxID=1869338 RepID=UPI002F948774
MSSSNKRKRSDSGSSSDGSGSGFVDLSGKPPKKQPRAAPPVRERSSRIQQNKQKAFDELRARAGPSSSQFDPLTDVTPHLMAPLDPGADGRGYVEKTVRRDIERQMKSGVKKFDSLEKSNVPKFGQALRKEAAKEGRITKQLSTRGAHDEYRSGEDHTFTEYAVRPPGKRAASDTPRPRSPSPEGSGRLSKGLRYEDAHQAAFRFTGLPGSTVHAPTQANQVVDSGMERFIEGRAGGFIHRHDTYTHSQLTAARPLKGGQWETMQASYRRRPDPVKASTPSKSSDVGSKPTKLSAPISKGAGKGGSPSVTPGLASLPKSTKGSPKGGSGP